MTIFGGGMWHAQTFATILYVGKSLIRVYEGEPMFDRTSINWVFPAFRQDPKKNPQCPNVKPTKQVVFLPFVCKGHHNRRQRTSSLLWMAFLESIPRRHKKSCQCWDDSCKPLWFLGTKWFFQKNLLFSKQFLVCAFGSRQIEQAASIDVGSETRASDWEALLDFLHQQENLPRTAATLQGNWGQEGKRALQSYLKKTLGAILEAYSMIFFRGASRVARDDVFSNQMRSERTHQNPQNHRVEGHTKKMCLQIGLM